MEIDHARLERQATVEARLLARRLRSLPQAEVEPLTRAFVVTFLRELLVSGHIDVSTVLGVITESMDLAIDHRKGEGSGEPGDGAPEP